MNKIDFERDGIVWPIRGLPADESATLETRYLEFQTEATRIRGRQTHSKPHLISTWLDDIAHNPIILDAVETALGPNLLLWETDFSIKASGSGTWIPWHQDTPYWNLSSHDVVSVWLAITPATRATGAMQVIPGTHRMGSLGTIDFEGDPHAGYRIGHRTASPGNPFAYDHVMNEPIDTSKVADIELQPGEFSIHHVQLVHGGGPNGSDHDRIGFVMRYISADTYCRSGQDSAMLVRGEYGGGHFELEPRPLSDFAPVAMQAMAHALTFPSGFGDRLLK